jgi:hypothetical protein
MQKYSLWQMKSLFSQKLWETYFLFISYPELAQRTYAPYRKHVKVTALLRNVHFYIAFVLVYLLFIVVFVFGSIYVVVTENPHLPVLIFLGAVSVAYGCSCLFNALSDLRENLSGLNDSLEHAQRLEKMDPLIRSMLP